MLALLFERLIPPNSSEVSGTRLESGKLTCDELREGTELFGCQVVAPIEQFFQRHCPGFTQWAKANFPVVFSDGENEMFVVQPLLDA